MTVFARQLMVVYLQSQIRKSLGSDAEENWGFAKKARIPGLRMVCFILNNDCLVIE